MSIALLTSSSASRWVSTAVIATLVAAALLVSAASATAAISAGDRAATRTYVEANYALVRAARARLATSEAAIRGLASRTAQECPLVGEGSHLDQAANEFSEEIIGTMAATAYHPDISSIEAFTHAVGGLRWSSHKLTRIVRTYVTRLRNLAALGPANICADARAWAADGFQALPEATLQYNKLCVAANIEAEEVPLRLLAPYENAREVKLLQRTKRLEAPLADAEAKAVEYAMDILRALALST
ncbi:MAG TPA: hypothetical protein VGL57_11850 [Solirubrobacteraceae bacterium]